MSTNCFYRQEKGTTLKYIFTQEFYKIETVKLEFCDSSKNIYSIPMQYDKQERHWFCECDKEIDRYKFVVNDIIRLNDPNAGKYAEDEKWEVWSVPGTCTARRPELALYNISNNMSNGVAKAVKKAAYTFDRPLDIYTGVGIHQVKGLHSVTYICYQPNGSIFKLEECSIGQFEPNEADYEVVFKNHISPMHGRIAEGIWSFQIYLDGRCVVKDYFVLKRKVFHAMSMLNYKM